MIFIPSSKRPCSFAPQYFIFLLKPFHGSHEDRWKPDACFLDIDFSNLAWASINKSVSYWTAKGHLLILNIVFGDYFSRLMPKLFFGVEKDKDHVFLLLHDTTIPMKLLEKVAMSNSRIKKK